MGYVFFLDDSGHDHRTLHYEVRGGVVVSTARLAALTQQLRVLEVTAFGIRLEHARSAVGGARLLRPERLRWSRQRGPVNPDGSAIPAAIRQHLARRFLRAGRQGYAPIRDQFTAYGQACVLMAQGIFQLLREQGAKVFATAVPRQVPRQPSAHEPQELRQDVAVLLDRYYRFLDEQRESGLLVLGREEQNPPHRLGWRIERFLQRTPSGQQWAQRIIPFSLASAAAAPSVLSAADLCTYCVNHGVRLPDTGMTAPTRADIAQTYAPLVLALQWTAKQPSAVGSIVYVPAL